jgi:hypothetical protein
MGWQMLVAFACGALLGGAATIIVYSGDVMITRGVFGSSRQEALRRPSEDH